MAVYREIWNELENVAQFHSFKKPHFLETRILTKIMQRNYSLYKEKALSFFH